MKHLLTVFRKNLILPLLATLFIQQAAAQYYYRDIVLTGQNAQQQQLYKKNKVIHVQLLSYESNGAPSEDFECDVTPNNGYTQIRTITSSGATGSSSLTTFYNFKAQLYKSVDSSNEVVSTYTYAYDSTGKLLSATNNAYGASDKRRQAETHIWEYTTGGFPKQMLYIKDNADTTTVKFSVDEKGNVTEEESWWRNISKGKTYYYYDSLNHLTDIVRYNERLGRLMPDYMFEYNAAGQVVKTINIEPGNSDYLTWLYEYDDKGLRTTERCYNKQKRLVGKIEYQYAFR